MGMKVIPVISMISAIASLVPAVLQFRKNRNDSQSRKKRPLFFVPGRSDSGRNPEEEGNYIPQIYPQPRAHILAYISNTYDIGMKTIPAIGMIAAIASLVPAVLQFRKNRNDRQSRKKRPLFFVPEWSDSLQNWTCEVANLKMIVSACIENTGENPFRSIRVSDDGKFIFEIVAQQRYHARLVNALTSRGIFVAVKSTNHLDDPF